MAGAVTSSPVESEGPFSRAGEGQGEGCDISGKTWPLTPTLSRSGEGARRALQERPCLDPA
ncbi:hypothetical protein FV233_15335 [Methylobacterium sp. WL7]|nr:hypothetical protein FV233_15335 [Methylobacterium sp. WL7]